MSCCISFDCHCIKEEKLYKKKKEENRRIIPRYKLEALLYLRHNDPIVEHLGVEKYYKKIKRNYYWKRILEDVKKYIKLYNKYQKREKL